jgi:hypothetical protein
MLIILMDIRHNLNVLAYEEKQKLFTAALRLSLGDRSTSNWKFPEHRPSLAAKLVGFSEKKV